MPAPSDRSCPPLGLRVPLRFVPHYQMVVWGGRRLEAHRDDLPDGRVGESWDLADHERGMSTVCEGALQGLSLRELTGRFGTDLVGDGFGGGLFPLMVKWIDASDRLSLQVHPDDALARELGVGSSGKTECWLLLCDGGELYQGTKPGVDAERFMRALEAGRVEDTLNRFECRAGDFFFLPARTVHAIGAGCLLYEVQQTSDVTFRIWDWGRTGLDGRPRPTHLAESLRSIDFAHRDFGPIDAPPQDHPAGGRVRRLTDCPYFSVEERLLSGKAERTAGPVSEPGRRICAVLSCLEGGLRVETDAGSVEVGPLQTVLVPAAAGGWRARSRGERTRFLHAVPVLRRGAERA